MAWLYIGRLQEETDIQNVIKYLKESRITGEIDCEQLETRGRNRAFKIGFDFDKLEEVNDPDFWPRNVLVRPFRFRFSRREPQGASLRREADTRHEWDY